ncbi:hypothetical protein ABTW72_02920 [Micromonospora sp. NPDC127501]|uniref:hypothetical protein n=1 Tax=Micromonospora sp. NPDC127501 TaxID=3154872 RepID=UPI0033272DF9
MKKSIPLVGLVLGALGGALWGWWGGDGYEAGDSALGTGLMGAVVGLLIGAVVYGLVSHGKRNSPGRDR